MHKMLVEAQPEKEKHIFVLELQSAVFSNNKFY
jgi:hypothetical protein